MANKFGWIHASAPLQRPTTAALPQAAETSIPMATTVTIPTPVSPTPTSSTGGFKSFMDHIGHAFKTVLSFIGSPRGQATVAAVEGGADAIVGAINPAAGVALLGIQNLINSGLRQAVQVETIAVAAEQQSGTGLQKAAAVTAALAPEISAFLKSIGVSSPTSDQVQKIGAEISTGVVSILNAIPAPAVPAQ